MKKFSLDQSGPAVPNRLLKMSSLDRKLFVWLIIVFFLAIRSHTAGGAQEQIDVQEKDFLYDDHGKRDPMWPLVTSGGGIQSYESDFLISDLILEGIMVGEQGGNLAIINGRVVKEKDSIGQFNVIEIQSEFVVLVKGNERFVLKLK